MLGREHDLGIAVGQRKPGLADAVVAPLQAVTEQPDVEGDTGIEIVHGEGHRVDLAKQPSPTVDQSCAPAPRDVYLPPAGRRRAAGALLLSSARLDSVSFDPYAPYGPLVETTLRVVTWNVWGRFGDWEQRQDGIGGALAAVGPDVTCLVESWTTPETTQVERIADRLDLEHQLFVGDWDQGGWTSGIGVVSRWPIVDYARQPLPGDNGEGVGEGIVRHHRRPPRIDPALRGHA